MASGKASLTFAQSEFGEDFKEGEYPVWFDGLSVVVTNRRLLDYQGLVKLKLAFEVEVGEIETTEYKYNLTEYGIKIYLKSGDSYLIKNKWRLHFNALNEALKEVRAGNTQQGSQIGAQVKKVAAAGDEMAGDKMYLGANPLVTEEFDEMTGDKRYYGPEYQLFGPVGLFGSSKYPSAATKRVSSNDLVILQPAVIIEETGATSFWWAFKAVSAVRKQFDAVSSLITLVDGQRSTWESMKPIVSVLDNGDSLEVVMFQMDEHLFKDGHSSVALKIRVLNQDFEIVPNFKDALGQLLGAATRNQKQRFSSPMNTTRATFTGSDEVGTIPSGDVRADVSQRGPRRLDF